MSVTGVVVTGAVVEEHGVFVLPLLVLVEVLELLVLVEDLPPATVDVEVLPELVLPLLVLPVDVEVLSLLVLPVDVVLVPPQPLVVEVEVLPELVLGAELGGQGVAALEVLPLVPVDVFTLLPVEVVLVLLPAEDGGQGVAELPDVLVAEVVPVVCWDTCECPPASVGTTSEPIAMATRATWTKMRASFMVRRDPGSKVERS